MTSETPIRWEVRTALRYGSEHHSWHESENLARTTAERLVREKWHGANLQIHAGTRIIYIYPDDND